MSAPDAAATYLRQRRTALAADSSRVGIDFVEVESAQDDPLRRTLVIHFVDDPGADDAGGTGKHLALDDLAPRHLRFRVGDLAVDGLFEVQDVRHRGTEPRVEVPFRFAGDQDLAQRLGDAPIFTLVVEAFPDLDPFFDRVSFSLDLGAPPKDDCVDRCPPLVDAPSPPWIDYLARDYDSVRRLMLDHLGQRLPEWSERSPADGMVTAVEILADAADQLAYAQDAVGTEGYLATARRRVSVRRHARLIGYRMHEGSNARLWAVFEVDDDRVEIEPGLGTLSSFGMAVTGTTTAFLSELKIGDAIAASDQTRRITAIRSDTRLEVDAPFDPPLADAGFLRPGMQLLTRVDGIGRGRLDPGSDAHARALAAGATVFETAEPAVLFARHNAMAVYDWGADAFALPAGATRATLVGALPDLAVGRVVIFEEVMDQQSGETGAADPGRRWAVRLTAVEAAEDPLGGAFLDPPTADPLPITEVAWHPDDALPFALCVATVVDGMSRKGVTVARGNVVLADHGRTIGQSRDTFELLDPKGDRGRPRLALRGLSHRQPFDPRSAATTAASAALVQDFGAVMPVLDLYQADGEALDGETLWHLRDDLLASDRFARDFVVEMENDGTARLRFGDGDLGRPPDPDAVLRPVYRVGNGAAGNIGPEGLALAVSRVAGIVDVRNPLAAGGGRDREALDPVRRAAPGSLLEAETCTTEKDFARVAEGHPRVARAVASLRFTGSWHLLLLAVQPIEGRPVDDAFVAELSAFLEPFRIGGWEIRIEPLRFVGLDIVLTVSLASDAVRGAVERGLLEAFSDRRSADGATGFFHPDNLGFGESVYLSRVVEAAMAVPGVEAVDFDGTPPKQNRFRRAGEPSRGELASGQIRLSGLEIARVDNDPAAPENGTIRFILEGGR